MNKIIRKEGIKERMKEVGKYSMKEGALKGTRLGWRRLKY